ncbi:hypothetical protein TNCT_509101 [Trichonephila clavata]|uniref:Uncharacterized protein n=1 Tax=Trichonephila clavata TaxID=2740835 RepID=A0A8X6KUG7_TRICU|nr:hypothetical protein TNCT_509101 [Trichonephila clavata]
MKNKEDTKSLQNPPSCLRSIPTSFRCVALNVLSPTTSQLAFSNSVSLSLPLRLGQTPFAVLTLGDERPDWNLSGEIQLVGSRRNPILLSSFHTVFQILGY